MIKRGFEHKYYIINKKNIRKLKYYTLLDKRRVDN